MAAQEAGHVGRLRADIQAAAQKRAEQRRAHATRLATQISRACGPLRAGVSCNSILHPSFERH